MLEPLETVLQDGVQRGQFEGDPKVLARAFYAAIVGSLNIWLSGEDDPLLSTHRLRKSLFGLLIRGATPLSRLVRMSEEYAKRGVAFVLVYSNEPETLVQIAAHSYERDVPFLVLKDFAAELADMLGVSRTPSICVLDESKKLRYCGRIDDQYSVSSRRATARHHDLRDALDAVLTGEEVEHPEVAADGCPLNRTKPKITVGDLTYHEHVAPLIREACVECHRPGQIGPMSLVSYDDVSDHAETIVEVTHQRRMPPWQTYYRYADPVPVKAGQTIHSIAHWDNSANNLANPDPTVAVKYGLQSSEEMMYGFLTYVYDEPVKDPPRAKPNMLASMMFQAMDKDKSGRVESDEMPESMQAQLQAEGMQIRGGLTPLLLEALLSE